MNLTSNQRVEGGGGGCSFIFLFYTANQCQRDNAHICIGMRKSQHYETRTYQKRRKQMKQKTAAKTTYTRHLNRSYR